MHVHIDTIKTLFIQVDKAFSAWEKEPQSKEKREGYEDSKTLLNNVLAEMKDNLASN